MPKGRAVEEFSTQLNEFITAKMQNKNEGKSSPTCVNMVKIIPLKTNQERVLNPMFAMKGFIDARTVITGKYATFH